MRTWSVVGQKGGSGKTTLTLHLAVAADSEDGLTVSVVDLDPQRSAEQWSEMRERLTGSDEPAVVHGTASGLDGMLAAARDTGTDLTVIDTPPMVEKCLIYAAAAGDVVIVPTRTGVFDQMALRETLEYLKRMGGVLAKVVVVVNAATKDREARAETEAIAREFGVAVLDASLDDQADLEKSLREGRGATERGKRTKVAKAVSEVYRQIRAFEARSTNPKSRR